MIWDMERHKNLLGKPSPFPKPSRLRWSSRKEKSGIKFSYPNGTRSKKEEDKSRTSSGNLFWEQGIANLLCHKRGEDRRGTRRGGEKIGKNDNRRADTFIKTRKNKKGIFLIARDGAERPGYQHAREVTDGHTREREDSSGAKSKTIPRSQMKSSP